MLGLLPDHEILRLGSGLIEPFDPRRVQPASYDLTLHPRVLGVSRLLGSVLTIDLRADDPGSVLEPIELDPRGYALDPGECLIASTQEVIHCPPDIAARVEGKSSLGRLFLAVHVTAGWIDPGFQGQVTLEIINLAPWRTVLWPGMPIGQVNFTRLASPAERPYGSVDLGSHYQGQEGPTASSGRRGY